MPSFSFHLIGKKREKLQLFLSAILVDFLAYYSSANHPPSPPSIGGLQPGCPNGHSLLKTRMQPPNSFGDHESLADRKKRERFAHVVLDWHLRRGLKTALLDVGEVVPSILREFLADWKEAELLWMFEVRNILN